MKSEISDTSFDDTADSAMLTANACTHDCSGPCGSCLRDLCCTIWNAAVEECAQQAESHVGDSGCQLNPECLSIIADAIRGQQSAPRPEGSET